MAKETVPVKRVRLNKDTEQHEEQMSEQVRKLPAETTTPVWAGSQVCP